MKPVRRRLVAAAAIGMAAALGVSAAAQTPAQQLPTFKAEVEYVEVDALVTDERGEIVRDLRKEDFQILEDGRSQAIAGFAFVEIPIVVPDARVGRSVEPDVRSNEQPFSGRVYVLVLDSLHTLPQRTVRVKRAAQQFIDRHMAPDDLMAVVTTGGPSNGAQEFTSDRRLLTTAVDRFMGQKLQSATMARNDLYFAGPSVATGTVADPFEAERGLNARSTTRVLSEVAQKLSAIRGRRKSILFISEGLDYDITDVMNNRSASSILDGIRDTIAAATRSNASIYAVDPRGLTSLADEAIETGIFADQRPLTYREDTDGSRISDPKPGIGTNSLRSELQVSQDSLRILADETNGFAAVNSNDFDSAFARIVSANSSYYVLAYHPPPNRRDGRYHRIEVRTSRPGLTVRARRGYVVPKAGAKPSRPGADDISPPLLRALNSVVPTSTVKMRLFAAPFIGPEANGTVVLGVELQGDDLALADNQRVELAYIAVDASGETRAANDSFTFKLPAETKARIRKTGVRFLKRLSLPPNRYHFRVGVYDSATGAAGTVNYDLDLPDFRKERLAMSGLLIMSKLAAAMVTARGDPELQTFMKSPPVGRRTFSRDDDVSIAAEIYDRSGATPHTVDIVTTVTARAGNVVFDRSDERSSAELQNANGAFVHTIGIPVVDFAPGSYVLMIEARSRLGQSVSRTIEFEVTAP